MATEPSVAAKTQGVREAKRGQLPVFVEVVLEVDVTPQQGAVQIASDVQHLRSGYVLRRIGPNVPSRLYPATGRAREDADQQRLWVGTRFRNHLAHLGRDGLTLRSTDRSDYTLISKGAEAGANPWMQAYPGAMDIEAEPGGIVTVRLGDQEVRVGRGQQAVVSTRAIEIDRGRWADAVVADAKAEGKPAGDRKVVLAALGAQFPGEGPVRLFTRVTVINHGDVAVAAFDVLHQWHLAQETAAAGPYEEAEEALENVLVAVPDYRPAVDLLVEVTRLLDAGVSPALLTGTLAFPAGAPTDRHKALWKEHHSGVASLTPRGHPPGDADYDAPIEDGSFRIAAPEGTYQLTVAVPGFRAVSREVTLKGKQSVTIPLSP